jgi:hypothetical protein
MEIGSGEELGLRQRLISVWPYAHFALPAVAGVTILVCHHGLLGPVIDNGGDNASHMLAEYSLVQALAAGDNLLGPLSLDFGLPILRFYQSLFYLLSVGTHALTGVDLRFVHNLIVTTCFALSPFAYCYALLKLGLRRFAAGIASLVAIISAGAFGNSFEAYHGIGIATQAVGALFFPLFIGSFAGLLRGENRWSSAALLFALAFLAHAMMAVYSVLCGTLYILTTPVRLRPNLKRVALFAVIGAALVSFWALPFFAHTMEHRPVPDSITRGEFKRWWFTSVSEDQMVELAASGRMLDDPSVVRTRQTDPMDKLMDKVGMGATLHTRFPVVTVLTGLGLLVALFGFRRPVNRFLAAGICFSLMLFAGADDFVWLRYVPLIGLIHAFRCTYLVEFFAYGLVGVGAEALLRSIWLAGIGRGPAPRRIFGWAFAVVVLALIGACVWEISALARSHIKIHKQEKLDAAVDATRAIKNGGYPFRVLSMERWNSYRAWLVQGGYRAPCSHWGAAAPTSALILCIQTRKRPERADLFALTGIRYIFGRKDNVAEHVAAVDRDDVPLYRKLKNGPDRRGKDNGWINLLDSGRDHFLRPVLARPLPVVCNDRQWLWLIDSWMRRYGNRLRSTDMPIPMRVPAGGLEASGLLDQALAVFYIDDIDPGSDRSSLTRFGERGGTVITAGDVDGLETVLAKTDRAIWDYLPQARKGKAASTGLLEADEPAFERIDITRYDDPRHTNQRYRFDVDVLEPVVVVLPTAAVSGWSASIDGAPLTIFKTGPDMVGTLLPRGAHRIVFRWSMPGWHKALLITSITALIVALGWSLLGLIGWVMHIRSIGGPTVAKGA